MERVNKIFQIDSDIVKKYYNSDDNIKIIDNNDEPNKNCIIYFSSNEIYYPNTELSFINSIVKRDKYEWMNNLYPGMQKHIFVRDIQKQWYIEGCNSHYHTPELLFKRLADLTKGHDIYTIGSSAGGFAALLFGSILGAKRVYAFNAQLNLNVVLKNSSPEIDPLLYKYLSNQAFAKYFNVGDFLKPGIEYLYFHSAKSKMDIDQYEACKNKDLLLKIEFDTANHGFPFFRHDLSYVLNLTFNELKVLSQKRIHPFLFTVKTKGIIKAIVLTTNAVKKRIQKKLTERKHA